MDRRDEQVVRGNEAAQLLGSPMLQQAFEDTRQGIMETWAALPHSAADEQGSLLLMVKCLDKVRRAIEYHVETGRKAEIEIERLRKANLLSAVGNAINPFRG